MSDPKDDEGGCMDGVLTGDQPERVKIDVVKVSGDIAELRIGKISMRFKILPDGSAAKFIKKWRRQRLT